MSIPEVFNHLIEADGVPLDVLNKAACDKFTNGICDLYKTEIANALELSYLIAWAKEHKDEIIEA